MPKRTTDLITEALMASLAQDSTHPDAEDERFMAQAHQLDDDDYFEIPGATGTYDPSEDDE